MKKVIREEAFGDNRIDPADAGVQTTWIAYTVLTAGRGVARRGEVTRRHGARRAGQRAEGHHRRAHPDPALAVPGHAAPSVGFPRMVNADVTLQVVRDGRLVAAREGFVDVTKTPGERGRRLT